MWWIALAAVPRAAAAEPSVLDAPSEWVVRLEEPDAPRLDVSPLLPPLLEGVRSSEASRAAAVALGPRTAARFVATNWSGEGGSRGSRLAATLVHDLGFAAVVASASLNRVDGWLGGGEYLDLGVSLRKTFPLDGGRVWWLGLDLANRRWRGAGAAPSETSLMLVLGFTW